MGNGADLSIIQIARDAARRFRKQEFRDRFAKYFWAVGRASRAGVKSRETAMNDNSCAVRSPLKRNSCLDNALKNKKAKR